MNKMKEKVKALFFFGSGISRPSEIPGVKEITDSLLKEEWSHQTWNRFSLFPHGNREYAEQLQRILIEAKVYADKSFKSNGLNECNYEDLFFICDELLKYFNKYSRNPFIYDMHKNLLCLLDKTTCHPLRKPQSREKSISDCMNLIVSVVYELLDAEKEIKGLELLKDAILSNRFEDLAIFTLNHDTLIENYLRQEGIQYNDGFDSIDGDVRFFNMDSFGADRVNIYKLHGSVNWFLFDFANGKVSQRPIGIPLIRDVEHCYNARGDRLYLRNNGLPFILAGTNNKVYSYYLSIYEDMFECFKNELKKTNVVVMSGYGWNDNAVSTMMFKWWNADKRNRLFLLHKKPLELVDSSTSQLCYHYEGLRENHRLIIIEKWMCDTPFEELWRKIDHEINETLILDE